MSRIESRPFTSGGAVSCAKATEINRQSIPTAIAPLCQDGIAVNCVTPSDRCVRDTAMSLTVVVVLCGLWGDDQGVHWGYPGNFR
jgi:hypothetical protein